MSGFLHRLAAQTIGGTSTVRSAARQPYAVPFLNTAMPEGHSSAYDAESVRHQMNISDARWSDISASLEQRNPAAHAAFDAQLLGSQATPSLSETFAVPAASSQASDAGHRMASAVPVQAIAHQPDARAEGSTADEFTFSSEVAGEHGPSRNLTPGSRAADQRDSAFPDSAPLLPLGDLAHPSPSNAGFPMYTADDAAPQPLLPLKNSADAGIQNLGATARSRGTGHPAQLSDETTEVHVTIGRIEVTAIHEAAPPKRQAPAAAKPMTLDEYLARRRREA